MELTQIMNEHCISFDQVLKSKHDVFEYLIEQLYQEGVISSKKIFMNAVLYRETLSETGLTQGIAIPHGKDDCVNKAFIAYVRLAKEIPWESIDGNPIKHVFLLAIPQNSKDDMHIRMISQLARSLIKPEVIIKINESTAASELLKVISKKEETK